MLAWRRPGWHWRRATPRSAHLGRRQPWIAATPSFGDIPTERSYATRERLRMERCWLSRSLAVSWSLEWSRTAPPAAGRDRSHRHRRWVRGTGRACVRGIGPAWYARGATTGPGARSASLDRRRGGTHAIERSAFGSAPATNRRRQAWPGGVPR